MDRFRIVGREIDERALTGKEKNPFESFNRFPGIGRDAVREAFQQGPLGIACIAGQKIADSIDRDEDRHMSGRMSRGGNDRHIARLRQWIPGLKRAKGLPSERDFPEIEAGRPPIRKIAPDPTEESLGNVKLS